MTTSRTRPANSGVIINLGLIVIGIGAIALLLVAQVVQGDKERPGAPLDLSLAFDPVISGLGASVLLVGAGDGSGDRYIVEQPGRILRLLADDTISPVPFLDIRQRVRDPLENGLLGLVFHPAYEENGRFFVVYTRRTDDAMVLSEFTLPGEPDPPVEGEEARDPPAIEDTERPLLVFPKPYIINRGGMLEFDPEGMLLLSTGDGGSVDDRQDHALDPSSLLGKMLRLDVDRGWPYATPEDNGFADVAGARAEVHAIGLRDPWRFGLDRETGDIYIGDRGQGWWEEVNVLRPGERQISFGWDQIEGEECVPEKDCVQSDHRGPAMLYPHVDGDIGHCAIIGGYAYRGSAGSLPAGTYLYADHCSGTIWAAPAADVVAGTADAAKVGLLDPELGQILGFGQDDDGELYLLTSAGGVFHISEADGAA